jgi:hypothetical protein
MYVERFARRSGRWLIAHRELRIDWIVAGSALRPLLNLGAPPQTPPEAST